MLLERFYDEDLAQASYLIGCQATGDAVVVDPRRDIGIYLDAVKKHGLRITAVTETHIHADYLSGTRELAHATGADIFVSGEGGIDWEYGFPRTACTTETSSRWGTSGCRHGIRPGTPLNTLSSWSPMARSLTNRDMCCR